MIGQKHVDLVQTLRWVEGDERMLESIRVIFVKNVPEQVSKLGECLERGDTESAKRMARTIKGSAAAMGAVTMSCEAEKIEQSATERDLHRAKSHFATISEEFEKVMAALRMDRDLA